MFTIIFQFHSRYILYVCEIVSLVTVLFVLFCFVFETVSTGMICGFSLFSTSTNKDLSYEEDYSLSSTLQKLYNWEQKLLEEVMVSAKIILFRSSIHLISILFFFFLNYLEAVATSK